MIIIKGTFVVLVLFFLIITTYLYVYTDHFHAFNTNGFLFGSGPCEKPFVQIRNSCYFFSGTKQLDYYKMPYRGRVYSVPTKLDWLHATFSCETLDPNARPISIETIEEMQLVTNYMLSMGYPDLYTFWSSGHRALMNRLEIDPKTFNSFFWHISSEPMNYTNWLDGIYPDGKFPYAFCISLILKGRELFMTTTHCDIRLSYVCELELEDDKSLSKSKRKQVFLEDLQEPCSTASIFADQTESIHSETCFHLPKQIGL